MLDVFPDKCLFLDSDDDHKHYSRLNRCSCDDFDKSCLKFSQSESEII